MKTPRTYRTTAPHNPDCASCGKSFNNVQAVTVAYPTRNPKRVKSVSYCIDCTPYTPKF